MKSVASIYPTPFDLQIRHEYNSSIFFKGKIYSYEEGKITTVKNDGTSLFPEKSLMYGFKELKLSPKNIDLWILPQPKTQNDQGLYLFFSILIKAFKGNFKNFKKWKRKIKFIKHHDLHTYTAIGSSSFNKGVYFNIDGGGDEGDTRNFTWGKFNGVKLREYKNLKGLNSIACFHAFITEFCGFRDQNGKTSGLSAYGKIDYDLRKKLQKVLITSNAGIYFNRKRYNVTEPNINNVAIDSYDRTKIFKDKISKTNIFEICQGYLPQDVAVTAEDLILILLFNF